MKIITTEIEGVKIIEPDRFGDSRGWFSEVYSLERYRSFGIDAEFVQDNESFSSKGVIRGLHWQASPHTQAKLVRVARGAVWDVAVDIRKGSKTYGKHVVVELSAENGRQLFIPRGFAHGFVVLSETALFQYKCDNLYEPSSEGALAWDDADIAIEWPLSEEQIKLSEKDKHHAGLKDFDSPFVYDGLKDLK